MKNPKNLQFGENRLVFFEGPKPSGEAAKSSSEAMPKNTLGKIICDALQCKPKPRKELVKTAKKFMKENPNGVLRVKKIKESAKKYVKTTLEDDSKADKAANDADRIIQRLDMTNV